MLDDRAGRELPEDLTQCLESVAVIGLDYAQIKKDCEISISLVTADEIRQLNRDYRRQDRETDVLSFPFEEDFVDTDQEAFDGPPLALGDIVICPAVAEAQAQEYGHSYKRELAFLFTHGLLHLLGYDHEDPDDEARMKSAQDSILLKAGIRREE